MQVQICDLLWRNREQVASNIVLILGLSTEQQCMVFDGQWYAHNQTDQQFQCGCQWKLSFRIGCMVEQIGSIDSSYCIKSDTSRSDLFRVSLKQVTYSLKSLYKLLIFNPCIRTICWLGKGELWEYEKLAACEKFCANVQSLITIVLKNDNLMMQTNYEFC